MIFCSVLPIVDDLWHKPHVYGTVGFFIGVLIGIYCDYQIGKTRFNEWVRSTFGNTVYRQAIAGVCGFLGILVGTMVAYSIRIFCDG